MTILAMPNLVCNLSCMYCAIGKAKTNSTYNTDGYKLAEAAIDLARETQHSEIVLHGGEPLLWNIRELEKFLRMVSYAGLRPAIQTNATLITEKHIELFSRYNVAVGVSIDGGPDIGLSRGFWNDSESIIDNSKVVEKVMKNIKKMVERGINVGVIIVVHKLNLGDPDKINKLAKFITWLRDIGIRDGRLNPAFNSPNELRWDELLAGYISLYEIMPPDVSYTPFADITRLLMGRKDVTCWFGSCGLYDTYVWTVLPSGQITACDRTMWVEKQLPIKGYNYMDITNSKIRKIALMQTELKDSTAVHLHGGGCPAESPDGDFRRPSRFWKTWDGLFEYFNIILKKHMPFIKTTLDVDRWEYVEKEDICQWNPFNGEWICPQ